MTANLKFKFRSPADAGLPQLLLAVAVECKLTSEPAGGGWHFVCGDRRHQVRRGIYSVRIGDRTVTLGLHGAYATVTIRRLHVQLEVQLQLDDEDENAAWVVQL
jgi:hypothetical protein